MYNIENQLLEVRFRLNSATRGFAGGICACSLQNMLRFLKFKLALVTSDNMHVSIYETLQELLLRELLSRRPWAACTDRACSNVRQPAIGILYLVQSLS